MINPHDLMRLAIDLARKGIAVGQTPFGCAIAKEERIVSTAHNTVWASTDITGHAEMNAIRAACSNLDSIFLDRAIVATTCEPCPMCISALHWARVKTVYYGATIDQAEAAGFNELQVPAADLLRKGGSHVEIVAGVLADECKSLFDEWLAFSGHRSY